MMLYYINRGVKDVLDGCSMLSGMLFQLNWNPVPTYLEQGSILAVTRRRLIGWGVKGGVWRAEGWVGSGDRLWKEPPR